MKTIMERRPYAAHLQAPGLRFCARNVPGVHAHFISHGFRGAPRTHSPRAARQNRLINQRRDMKTIMATNALLSTWFT